MANQGQNETGEGEEGERKGGEGIEEQEKVGKRERGNGKKKGALEKGKKR